MKYMKLGTRPDTFYTEEAIRSVMSDVPTDLIIHINNTKYLLHKFPLLLKCGILQRLCTDSDDDDGRPVPIALHDIPGGEAAFELCAKFCYGIAINISANNFVPVILAAKFLRMTESVSKGNLVSKLETFFTSCILQGWKDSIIALQSAFKLSGWSENRILQPCMDSVVQKILTQPSKVTWSYTYTRPGYTKKQQVPKDWWTEDISELDLELFRSIISTVKATKAVSPALIGEALHVYACKHLQDSPEDDNINMPQKSTSRNEETLIKQLRHIECIVAMVPPEPGSVTGRFLLRLLKIANYAGASPSTKAELIRQAGRRLDEVSNSDLLIPLPSQPQKCDFGIVEALLESFLEQFRRAMTFEERQRMSRAMVHVAKIFDSFLQLMAKDAEFPVSKFIDLAESLPEFARTDHDQLYRAIDAYIKEHGSMSKADKKRMCRMIDARKLSPETRAEAIANDRMPLRTIVQLLFVEQERAGDHPNAGQRASVDVAGMARQDEEKTAERQQQREEPSQRSRAEGATVTRSLSSSKAARDKAVNDDPSPSTMSRIKNK